jgi:hypothetical protein
MRTLNIKRTENKDKLLSIDFENRGFAIFEILGFIEKLKYDIIKNYELEKQLKNDNTGNNRP